MPKFRPRCDARRAVKKKTHAPAGHRVGHMLEAAGLLLLLSLLTAVELASSPSPSSSPPSFASSSSSSSSSSDERVHELEVQLERERRVTAELRQQLTHLQAASCAFPSPASAATASSAAPPQLRMNTTCSTASLSSAPLEVEIHPPRGTLYADTRTTMFDMAPESSFAEAASVKVATVGCGSREWQPTQNTSRTKLQSQLQMAKADGAQVALMFEYSLKGAEPNTPMTLSGPEVGAMRALAREVGIIVICPLNLTLPDGTSRNAAVVILSNGTLLRAAFTGGTHAEKNYPGYGWRPGMANYGIDTGNSAVGRACPCRGAAQSGCVGPCLQGGEQNLIPSQVGVEVFDLPGIARVAILTCFDVYFPEVWAEAAAMGAQIVFWPTDESTPDRNVNSYAAIHRYHYVGNGQPGGIFTDYGRPVDDIKYLPGGDPRHSYVTTGTIDLDSTWFHENGPYQCDKVVELCNRYPGVFHFVVPGCNNGARQHQHASNCTAAPQMPIPGWHPGQSRESVFKIMSKDPGKISVKQAARELGLLSFRDYIFGNRQALNSLRQRRRPISPPQPPPPPPPAPQPAPAVHHTHGNVLSAVVLHHSKNSAAAAALVELYGQQSQSVAAIAAVDLVSISTETEFVLTHTKVLVIPHALNLTTTAASLLESVLLAWVHDGGLLVAAAGALADQQLSVLRDFLGIQVSRREQRCNVPLSLIRSTSTVLSQNWEMASAFTIADQGYVIAPAASGGIVIVDAQCENGASQPFMAARQLGAQRGRLAYVSSDDSTVLKSVADFLHISSYGCTMCSQNGLPTSRYPAGPKPMTITDCEHGNIGPSKRAPTATLDFVAGDSNITSQNSSGALNRYRVTLAYLDSAVPCSGTSCRLCFDFLTDWFTGGSNGYAPPTTRLLFSDAGLRPIAAMQADIGLRVCATVEASAELPLSFEITSAYQKEQHFHCVDDEDCELNGKCAGTGKCVCDPGWQGASCGQLRLLPALRRGIWPASRPRHHASPKNWSIPGYQNLVPVSWGGSIMSDAVTGKAHGFFATGCFQSKGAAHVTGYQVVHAVSENGPQGPFTFKEVWIPEWLQGWTCNPHCSRFHTSDDPRGVYVCFLSIGNATANPRYRSQVKPLNETCTGAETAGNASSRPDPYPTARLIGSCSATSTPGGKLGSDKLGSTCAIYTRSMLDGPWYAKDVFANQLGASNAGAWQLRNGSVVVAYAAGGGIDCGTVPDCDVEPVKLSIADSWDGPYRPVGNLVGKIVSPLWARDDFGNIVPSEDPTFFQDKRGFLHLITHSGGGKPNIGVSLHAFSRTGSYGSWRLGTGYYGSPYTTNVSWAPEPAGGQAELDTPNWTQFFRRERPELHLDKNGAPEYVTNGVTYGLEHPQHQYSFTLLQWVNSTPTVLKTDDLATLRDPAIASSFAPMYLDGDWTATNVGGPAASAGSLAATVPGDILTDLQRAKRVPDPYWNTTWRELTFVATWNEGIWTYSKTFDAPISSKATAGVGTTLLVLDGVRNGAIVSLNGVTLFNATDQFLRYTYPVTLKPSGNVLSLAFGAVLKIDTAGRFTDSQRLDWAPAMLTREIVRPRLGRTTFGFGIWKSVYLLPVAAGSVAIAQLVPHTFYSGGHPITRLADDEHKGFDVHVKAELWCGTTGVQGTVSVKGTWPGATAVSQPVTLPAGTSTVNITLAAAQTLQARLWHPNGHGDQVRYAITATFTPANATNTTVATTTRKLGFRHVALVTINDTDTATATNATVQDGSGQLTMLFRVNGAAMYARGANKVPMELLDGRMSAVAHRRLVQSAAEAHFNMLRVWDGGVWEPSVFYDACDELGVMIYHDMQFSGSHLEWYSQEDFQVARQELQHQIQRLSHHRECGSSSRAVSLVCISPGAGFAAASIALWNGCNECGGGGLSDPFVESFVMTTVSAFDRSRPVWPSSPSDGWASGVDRLSGRPNSRALTVRNNKWPKGPCGSSKCPPAREVGRPSGFPFFQEAHGPYFGHCAPNAPCMLNDTTMALAAETPPESLSGCNCAESCTDSRACASYATPARTGAQWQGWYRSEFGAVSWPSFESVSANLPKDQWGMSQPSVATITRSNADQTLRNWNVSSVISTFFGDGAASDMQQSGEVAFKRQLYQSMLGQLLFLKTEIESWRSTNVWGSTFWMFNAIWPTADWGSIEYSGGAQQPGQVLGGRWRPLHYQLRASTFVDHLATCNSGGACFVTNSAPFAFRGKVEVRLLNTMSGKSAQLKTQVLDLPPGPGVTEWFCADGLRQHSTATPGATASGKRQGAYEAFENMLPTARNLTNSSSVGTLAQCEAECDKNPGCQGFTHGSVNPAPAQGCYFYFNVKSLTAAPNVEWFQKPTVKPFPCPSGCHATSGCVCPGPPPPPLPPPAPPPCPPPPPQLACLSWMNTTGWRTIGCDANGSNCVLDISVIDNFGARVSHNVNMFVAPKHITLPKATISFKVDTKGAIALTTTATALYVVLTTTAVGRFSDNAVFLEAGVPQVIDFISWNTGGLDTKQLAVLSSSLRVEHLQENL
jgi:predicted amidohydrolase